MNSASTDWMEQFPAAITVCDQDGTIIGMNSAACRNFAKQGGAALIGGSLFSCHGPRSNDTIRAMLESGQPNTYLTDTRGKKRLVHQSPWFRDGRIGGLVELVVDLEGEIEVKKR